MSLRIHQRRNLVPALGLCCLLFAFAPIEKPTSSGFDVNDWVIECVDCPRSFDNLTNRSATLDANDLPHVAYGGEHLYYGYLDGDGEWQSEIVDDSPHVGFSTAMVLDSNGHPHILYYDSANGALKYASYDGADWQIEPFPFGSLTDPHLSLAVDSSDKLHVSRYDDVAGDLIYGVQTGSGWSFEVVDSNDDVGKFSAITLDGNDFPHISYHDVTNTQLKYAFFDGIDWTIQTFPEANQYGYDTDITLDQDGYIHIVYRGRGVTGKPALMYRFQDIAGWHLEIVDESEMSWMLRGVGYFNSIEIDYKGEPHVSYSAKGDSWDPYSWHFGVHELRYAHRINGSWNVELVNGWYAKNSTILLNNSGDPSIIYKEETELRYASKNDLGWGEITLDSSEFVGQYSSLDMVFLDQPHVSYHEAEGDSIKYAVRGSGGWSVLRIDDAGRYASNLTALSLSPNGNPHILYAQHMRYYTMGPLRHAYSDGENWVREAVLDDNWSSYPWYPGAFDLVVDLQGHVHVIQGGNMDGPGAWYLYKDTSWREPERRDLIREHLKVLSE